MKFIKNIFCFRIKIFFFIEASTLPGSLYSFFQVSSSIGIDLWVNTDNEVRIALTSFNILWNPTVEIVIGTNNNTLSTIIRNQGTRVVTAQSPNIIRQRNWTGLRITWVNNLILVTIEGQDFPFLAYNLEDIFPVQFYGLRSP